MSSRTRVLSVLVLCVALGLTACGTKDRPTLGATVTNPDGAITPVKPSESAAPAAACVTPSAGESTVATASTSGALAIYDQPGAAAPSRTLPNPRLINNDPNAKVPLVFLVKDIPADQGCGWVEVYLPVRPNGSTGWVKASDVTLATNPYRLQVQLGQFTLTVFKDDQLVNTIPIGVARDNTPTPGGLYFTTELIKTPDPSGAYGPFAFGLSGFSDTLTSFNGGPGQLGIHGTNQPELIGTKVSHGCIRMSNQNITTLAGVLPLGTPVQISA